MEEKNKVDVIKEIEGLRELIEREKAAVTLVLIAASGHDRLEEVDVVMTMRDCCERIEKMELLLERISKLIL